MHTVVLHLLTFDFSLSSSIFCTGRAKKTGKKEKKKQEEKPSHWMTVHIKQSPGKLLLLKAEFYGMDKEIRERTSDILNFNSHKTRQIKEGK